MNIAILHYHLNRGGVTQVILNHLRSLAAAVPPGERWRVALLYGGRKQDWPDPLPPDIESLDLSYAVVNGLDYDDRATKSADRLRASIAGTLRDAGFEPSETVLHVHNHALGKNVALPGAMTALARRGCPVLLQIHDFPEDFRPANYRCLATALAPDAGDDGTLPAHLYPQASHIHYAVLNRRDLGVLDSAGIDSTCLHLLPNPVADFGELPSPKVARERLSERFGVPTQDRYVLYPVRAIRRKNIGEAMLWSALAETDIRVGITLAPLNPIERANYEEFLSTAVELELPMVFEAGGPEGPTFFENLAAADLILTTSVAEGFGMVFAEAWLAGRPLAGRDLPDITADFKDAGVQFPGLQPRLNVPLDWIGADEFRRSLLEAYRSVASAYGRPLPDESQVETVMRQITEKECVDFASLTRRLQQRVLRKVCAEATCRGELRQANAWIGNALLLSGAADLIAANAEAVRSGFSLTACGKRLVELYRRVMESPRDQTIAPPPHGHNILDSFLDLARFHPIRTEA